MDYSNYELDSYYRYMKECDEIAADAYCDYPEIYNNEAEYNDIAYEYGAESAYTDNPQRLMNQLIGYVL